MKENDFIIFLKKEFGLADEFISQQAGESPKHGKSLAEILKGLSGEQALKGGDWDEIHSQAWKRKYQEHYSQALSLGQEAIQALEIRKRAKNPAIRRQEHLYGLPKYHSAWFREVAIGALASLVIALGLAFYAPNAALKAIKQADRIATYPAKLLYSSLQAPEEPNPIFTVAGVDPNLSEQEKAAYIVRNQDRLSGGSSFELSRDEIKGRVLGAAEERMPLERADNNPFMEWLKRAAQKQMEASDEIGRFLRDIVTQ